MAEALAEAGVKRIYGIVGDSLSGFADSLRRMKKIDPHLQVNSKVTWFDINVGLPQQPGGPLGAAAESKSAPASAPGCDRLRCS